MCEGTARQAAMMFGLVAEMNALIAEMEGMKAENQLRASNMESPYYSKVSFDQIVTGLNGIAYALNTKI